MIIHADAGDKPLCKTKGLVMLTIYSIKITCTHCKKAMKKT